MGSGNKLGWILIVGGVLIGAITVGGYFLSQNPRMISSLFSGNSGPDLTALDADLQAPASCSRVPSAVIDDLCAKIGDYKNPPWQAGLTSSAQNCMADAFADYRPVVMAFHRETEDIYSDDDRNAAVFGLACEIQRFEETNRESDSGQGGDVAAALNRYYRDWKTEIYENR